MTRKAISIFTIVSCLLLTTLQTSCEKDTEKAGAGTLRDGEDVVVLSDTIRNITSTVCIAPPIQTSPDSCLLGELSSKHFGIFKADILTQFAAPLGFQYPDSSVLDSACLYLYYRYYVGDGHSPLRITAYAMDGEVMEYEGKYLCTEPVDRFCSLDDSTQVTEVAAVVEAEKGTTDTVTRNSGESYLYRVHIPFTDAFARKLFAIKKFDSQEEFNEVFKGLYITTDFGTGTLLYIVDASIGIHYHYFYKTGSDTYARQNDTKQWYSNDEVRLINRYDYRDLDLVHNTLLDDSTRNYITSPMGLYTQIIIPMNTIREQVLSRVGSKRPYVNLANLRIDILNHDSKKTYDEDWAGPSSTMLLIKEAAFEHFFYEDAVVSDTSAMYSDTYQEVDSVTAEKRYYYRFSMASLLTEYLRDSLGSLEDTLSMIMVPVDVVSSQSSSGSSVISEINQKQTWTVTAVRSSADESEPMDIEIVYSGFSSVIL